MSEREQKPLEDSDKETKSPDTDPIIPGEKVQGMLLTNSKEINKDNKRKLNG